MRLASPSSPAPRAVLAAPLRVNWRGKARAWCVARSQKALESLDDDIRGDGQGEATLVPLDLRDFDGIDRLGAALHERYGKLDALAACAGVLSQLTPVHQATPALMDETFKVNVLANQRLIRAFHPLLRAADAGRAVFLTCSVAASPAYWGAYAASKAALDALVVSYAAEVAITPIRANLFDPGPTATLLRSKAFPGEDPKTLTPPEAVAPSIVALLDAGCAHNGERLSFAPRR